MTGNMLRREFRMIVYVAATVVVALALPVLVIIALDNDIPVGGIVGAGAILFVALLLVLTFATLSHHRAPPNSEPPVEIGARSAQRPTRQRS